MWLREPKNLINNFSPDNEESHFSLIRFPFNDKGGGSYFALFQLGVVVYIKYTD